MGSVLQKKIPSTVIKRLTKYLTCIQGLRTKGQEWVSSQELAGATGATSSSVRQDLTHLDFSGISKRGYATQGLEAVLAKVLGADSRWRMVVVGAGNLGRALALHQDFLRLGFMICGAFDCDPRKVGTKIGKLTVLDMDGLSRVIRKFKVDIGIIAVPPPAAQGVADRLVISGVRGLLNLSLAHVITPKSIPVIESRIVSSMLELAYAINATASLRRER